MSSLTLAEEISARLIAASARLIVKTQDETQERPATLEDIRDVLRPLGLDVTTDEAISWDTKYPGYARDITRICELQQQIDVLQAERDALFAAPVPIEKKEAAE